MNKINIELNKKYKSYRELCEVLEESVKTGKAKQLQLDDWKRHFKFEKVENSNKIKVTEIYTEVKERVDNRGKNTNSHNNQNGIYQPLSAPLILEFLRTGNKDDICYASANTIASNIKAFNGNYMNSNKNRDKFTYFASKSLDCSNRQAISDFWYSVPSIIKKSVVESGLKKLQDNGYIEFTKGYILMDIVTLDNGQEINSHMADSEDTKIIKKLEKEVAVKMGYKTKEDVPMDKINIYYLNCNSEIKEYFNEEYCKRQIFGNVKFKSYYVGFKIEMLKKVKEINEVEKVELEKNLNETIINRVYSKFINKQEEQTVENDKKKLDLSELEDWEIELYKDKLENEEKKLLKKWQKNIVDESYLKNVKKLLDTIIKIGAKDINHKLAVIKLDKTGRHIGLYNKEMIKKFDKMMG